MPLPKADCVQLTIFINWSIVVIASCNEWTTSCALKICSSMILKGGVRTLVNQLFGNKPQLQSINHRSYHVIINKRATLLNKFGNTIC